MNLLQVTGLTLDRFEFLQDLADEDRGIAGWISTFSHGSGCRSCPAFFATKMDEAGTKRTTWRIPPVSKWLVTSIYKPFRPFGRGITRVGGPTNHGY